MYKTVAQVNFIANLKHKNLMGLLVNDVSDHFKFIKQLLHLNSY